VKRKNDIRSGGFNPRFSFLLKSEELSPYEYRIRRTDEAKFYFIHKLITTVVRKWQVALVVMLLVIAQGVADKEKKRTELRIAPCAMVAGIARGAWGPVRFRFSQ
jgi:hypothetical protein